MKTITFQGEQYNVPDWAKWISIDQDGVYVWPEKPSIRADDGCFVWDDRCEKIADHQPLGVCEELP